MDRKRLVKTTLVLTAVIAASVFSPLIYHDFRMQSAPSVRPPAPLEFFPRRTSYESELLQLGMLPLRKTCKAGAPEAIIFFSSGCSLEHVVRIDFDHSGKSATVTLRSGGYARFKTPQGDVVRSQFRLDAKPSGNIYKEMRVVSDKLRPYVDDFQLPTIFDGFETCFSGTPFLALREAHDEDFNRLADVLIRNAKFDYGAAPSAPVCL